MTTFKGFDPNRVKMKLRLLMYIFLAINSYIPRVNCSSAMKRLYEDLFTDYNRLVLPVANNKTKVTVNLGLKLGQILDLNLKQQILSTNVWVEQTWHDYKLQWDSEQYEGIDMIHVPAENIWIPDIVLFNNADGNYELTLVAKARLYSNGTVVWKPPTMFRSTCEIDVEFFPFDIQTCYLRFGSWTYAGDEVELKHVGTYSNQRGNKVEIGIDLSQFYKNVEWDIIDVPAYYNEVYYDCCEESFPDVTFAIVIRRKMLFYLVNLILPVALMTFMTVSVFYLPSDSNEKVTLSISILTSLVVFILLMLEIIPASSLAVPLFGKYLLFALVLVSLSACISVYVLNLHHRSPSLHEMSPRMRQIFLKTLPRLLRLNRPDPRERSSLNRFRKKKIAQQLLKASSANKVYDLAQPLAASLNLIETLHRSYNFNPKDDGLLSGDGDNDDDEGRYFRRYVDNYIEHIKKVKSESNNQYQQYYDGNDDQFRDTVPNSINEQLVNSRCSHKKCCSQANQPYMRGRGGGGGAQVKNSATSATSCCAGDNLDWTESVSGGDMRCSLINGENAINSASDNNNLTTKYNKLASLDGSSAFNNLHNGLSSTTNTGHSMSRAHHSHEQQDRTLLNSRHQHNLNHHHHHHHQHHHSHPQQYNYNQQSNKQQNYSDDICCKTSTSCGCTAHQSTAGIGQLTMLNDDTLDMTFDYDDQENGGTNVNVNGTNKHIENFNNNNNNCNTGFVPSSRSLTNLQQQSGSSVGLGHELIDDLPSPPPPPRQLTQLSDSIQHHQLNGRLSSCSKGNLQNESSDENLGGGSSNISGLVVGNMSMSGGKLGESALIDQSRLVDKLINSINMINNASDEMDTTTTTPTTANSNNEAQQDNRSDVSVPNNNNYMIHQQQQSLVFDQNGTQSLLNQNKKRHRHLLAADSSETNIYNLEQFQQQNYNQQSQDSIKQCQQQTKLSPNGNSLSQQQSKCICKDTSVHSNCNGVAFNALNKKVPQHSSSNSSTQVMFNNPSGMSGGIQQQQQQASLQQEQFFINRDFFTNQSGNIEKPSDLLMSLRLSYDQMPAHVRAAIRSILFIADAIKNEDDENSAIEDWESVSMVVDRLFLWIFFLLCTFGSFIILALAPSLYDTRASIDDKLRIDIPPSNCSASLYGH